jgi:ATP-dependent Clp protease ATP-binding subunit ClpA
LGLFTELIRKCGVSPEEFSSQWCRTSYDFPWSRRYWPALYVGDWARAYRGPSVCRNVLLMIMFTRTYSFSHFRKKPEPAVKDLLRQLALQKTAGIKNVRMSGGNQRVTSASRRAYDVWKKYGRISRNGTYTKAWPVIGATDEIRKRLRILSSKQRTTPVYRRDRLEKTAIVWDLRCASCEMFRELKGALYFLSIWLTLAPAPNSEESWGTAQSRTNDVKKSGCPYYFFIRLNKSSRGKNEGAMDAGNILKPMLARGELHCIARST